MWQSMIHFWSLLLSFLKLFPWLMLLLPGGTMIPTQLLNATYSEVVRWIINSFKLFYGIARKAFVFKLFVSFITYWALKAVGMKAEVVKPILLFPKPLWIQGPGITLHERRLRLWHDGDLNELVSERMAIQHHLFQRWSCKSSDHRATSFTRLISQGKMKTSAIAMVLYGGLRACFSRMLLQNASPEVMDTLRVNLVHFWTQNRPFTAHQSTIVHTTSHIK